MLHPIRLESEAHAEIFKLMGYCVIEVGDERGEQLLRDACAALKHQVEIAYLVDGIKR